MTPPFTLLFVYNADSGLFHTLTDFAHKILAPHTYRCNLCALTYSTFTMKDEWKSFWRGLDHPVEFLHADELRERYGITDVPLPAVFQRGSDGRLKVWITAAEINRCRTMRELQDLVTRRLAAEAG